MANLYRKKSLQKLSSPEQLDKMIVINSPLVWVAIIGGFFIIGMTLLWAILGRVPITEEGQGIILKNGSLTSVYSKTKGVVTKVHVTSGDRVEAGDVLYEVKSEEVVKAVSALAEKIAGVDAVTLESANDSATTDNQQLLEIKAELAALGNGDDLNGISLADLEARYEEKKLEVEALASTLSAAEANYYNALASDDGAALEYDYSIAASEYEAAEQVYQAADTQYQTLKAEAENYRVKWKEYKALYDLDKTAPEAETYLTGAQEYKKSYETAAETLSDYKNQLKDAKSARDSAKSYYESVKASYEGYVAGSGTAKAEVTRYTNEYSQALSAYNSAKAELDSYESQITSSNTQTKVDAKSQDQQRQQLEEKFVKAKEVILESLQKEMDDYGELQEGANILAEASGTVYSTFAANGSVVSVDSEVARINTDNENKLYAVYYMGLGTGKNVKPGMKIHIYPTNVSKEEYGHMEGEVTAVANYVTSAADLVAKLGDETLAATFTQAGSVIEVTCEIKQDESTSSGFYWSSKKGATLELSEGTLLEGSVITENAAPITMLIPKLKEKFNLE